MLKRTHHCGALRPEHIGQTITLNGWVDAYRDHGSGLVFIDVRDREGVTQLVFDKDDASPDLVEQAAALRIETVIAARGEVRARASVNPKLPTGEVELVVKEFEVLSTVEQLPFVPSEQADELPGETTRMEYRYIDLRRPSMQRILRARHRITKITRDFFDEHGFLEIETPYLCRSTPEGARDFLVPSRLSPGEWYALPQSPQLFKQLLMISGIDRYLQIPRCFRDEDPRADRQAEFTQIDLEMSFVDREDVLDIMESFARTLWKEMTGFEAPAFPRITYAEAMARYGSDRPDTRFGLELVDISDLASRTDFKVFTDALAKPKGVVKAIRVPGGADKLTRKMTDKYTEFVKDFGAGGVPVCKVAESGLDTGIARFLEPIDAELRERLGAKPGDTILFGADTSSVCTKALGELRIKVARDMDLVPEGAWNFLWVVDFPMFEHDPAENRYYALHHPFTAPSEAETERFLAADPSNPDEIESIVSNGYDMVLNGSEIGGGSIRIHRQDIQQKVFDLLGMSREEASGKFSFLLDALRCGAPPHGGIAFGLDRIVMHLCGTDNIRDVIAFPKTHTGTDLMSKAPNAVDDKQLQELHVRSTAIAAP
ncbi:MAG: aspartate--tRNA ligase [Phycisphaerales bacterium JB037]